MKIIGIVGRCGISYTNRNTIEVYENYRLAVIKNNAACILILPPQKCEYYEQKPNELEKLTDYEKEILDAQLKLCDGIIMPGGNKRFEYDNYICKYCEENDIPVLGICMGMQIMCNYKNDNKNIEIPNHYSTCLYKHEIKLDKTSLFFQILKCEQIKVNSFHHYRVQNSGTLKSVAYCDDIIEAVEDDTKKFFIGVQYHPERNLDNDIYSQSLFEYFINKC